MNWKKSFYNLRDNIGVILGTGMAISTLTLAAYFLIDRTTLHDSRLNRILRNTDTNQDYVLEETELQELYKRTGKVFVPNFSNPKEDFSYNEVRKLNAQFGKSEWNDS